MAEVREFLLPDLGEGLTEALIVRWLVEVGEVVAVDQPVVEVETAKAMVEVPCPYGGVVTARYGEEGTEIPVGATLVAVAVGTAPTPPGAGGPNGAPSTATATDGAATAPGGRPGPGAGSTDGSGDAAPRNGSGNVLVGYGTGGAAPRRRRVRTPSPAPAHAAAAPPAPVPAVARPRSAAAAEAGRPVSSGATSAPAPAPVRVISPLVRRLARQHSLDLRTVTGTGPDGLILRRDIERAVEQATAPPATAPGRAPRLPDEATRVPLKGLRRTVADKLSRSRREIPDATCWVDVDATELLAARTAMNAGADRRISLLAVLARITTAALARFPALNSTVDLDRQDIVHLPSVHLGFAAQTERGLVVPVVRDAHRLTTAELSAEITRLTDAARAGTLTPAELTGGTFTLNNYGVFGVDGSTPIINHPEAGMLGIGRIAPKPWVHQGELAVRQVTQLSFTFDHRVCDGGTAGGFLRFVADCVEQPAVLLRHL